MSRTQSHADRFVSQVSAAALLLGWAAWSPIDAARAQTAPEDPHAHHHEHEHETPPQNGAEATVEDVQVNLGHSHGGHGPGEKLLENVLTKTSRSGAVVTETVAKDQQIDNLVDISHYVPNYRPNIAQPRQSRMAIRGVGIAAGSAGSGSPSDTGYIVDNVYWSFAGFQWGDLIDYSSVELLLGPTGTAGTKNTNVGSVVVHTQLPSFENKTTLSTTYGNYNRVKQTVNSTGTLIDNTLAYRFAGYINRGDGWIRDAGTGSTYLDVNRLGLHAQLLAVGDNWSDRISFIYNASNEHNDYLTGTIGDTSLVYANRTQPKTTFFQNVASKLGKPILTLDPNTPYISRNGRDPAHVFMLSNDFNYQLGENTFTSITAVGYGSFRNNGFSDNQLLQLGFSSGGMDTYVLQTSQEFRLSSPKDQTLEWTTGFFSYGEALEDRMHHYDFGADTAAWLGTPAALPGVTAWWLNKAGDIAFALYGQATWHATDELSLTFGLRDSYDIRYSANKFIPTYYYFGPYSIQQQDAAIIKSGGYGLSDAGGSTSYHNGVTGIFNPKYQVNENILVYGLVGRGDKAPAVNTQNRPAYLNGVFQGFLPPFDKAETSWDYEIGTKTNWLDGKLISNVNLYWNDLYNFQISQNQTYTSGNVTTNVAYLGNAPHVRLRGVEFVERWTPFEHLTLNLSGAYTEARFVDYRDSPAPTDWSFAGAPTTLSLSNTRLTGLPWWQINGGYAYHEPIGRAFADFGGWIGDQSFTVYTYGNASWFNKAQYTSPWSLIQYWQPAYVMFDAGFGIHTDDRRFEVTLWSKNLFNNRPWTSWSPGTTSAPTTVGISTQGPRTFGFTSTVSF